MAEDSSAEEGEITADLNDVKDGESGQFERKETVVKSAWFTTTPRNTIIDEALVYDAKQSHNEHAEKNTQRDVSEETLLKKQKDADLQQLLMSWYTAGYMQGAYQVHPLYQNTH